VSVVLVAEPGVLRENRADVYASERVQKASRTYMGEYLLERLCHELSGYRKNFLVCIRLCHQQQHQADDGEHAEGGILAVPCF
jgi:hypothetical protein